MTADDIVSAGPCADAGGASLVSSAVSDKAKRRATLAAQLALRGYELIETRDGTYIVSSWNLLRPKCCLDRVDDFARQVGAAL